MKKFLLLLAVAGCGVGTGGSPESLGAAPTKISFQDRSAAQSVITDLTTAVLNQDVQLLKTVVTSDSLLAAGETASAQEKTMATFLRNQREGLVMTYGEVPPTVVEVLPWADGDFTVLLSKDGMTSSAGGKPINMYKDANGKIYWAGAHPHQSFPKKSPVSLAAAGTATICVGGDTRCTQAPSPGWDFKLHNYAAGNGNACTFGIGGGNNCPSGLSVCWGPVAFGNSNDIHLDCVWNSCADKVTQIGGGPGCIGDCCWYNIFGDDFWWWSKTGGLDGRGTKCHNSQCPSNN
jgi:hypothetical protein